MDGYWLVTGLSYEAAVLRAKKFASFIEEDGKSAECKLLRQNGASQTLKRTSFLTSRVRVWRGGRGALRRADDTGSNAGPLSQL